LPYRSLLEQLANHDTKDGVADLLQQWRATHAEESVWLVSLRERGRCAVPPATEEELWHLYALSRVCESLVHAASCHPNASGAPLLSMAQVESFLTSLGIEAIRPQAYAPFHHEIVSTIAAPNDVASPSVQAWHWPCFMLGSLLIMRGGVTVTVGARALDPVIASTATLYWAYSREGRPTHDLAHGWGSNSSWRTAFRRDYRFGNVVHYNVDGSCDLALVDQVDCGHDHDDLTRMERIELLVYRSFVTNSKEHQDRFPYDDRLSTSVAAGHSGPPGSLWRRLFL
jgi:hypothetical protein